MGQTPVAPRRFLRLSLAIGAAWLVFLLFDTSETLVTNGLPSNFRTLSAREVLAPSFAWAIAWTLLAPLLVLLARELPPARRREPIFWLAHGLAAVLLPLLLVTIFLGLAWVLLGRLPTSGAEAFARWRRNASFDLFSALQTHLAILVLVWALDRVRARRETQLADIRLRQQLAEARLQALRMQLDPHFVFNALGTVLALTRSNPASAQRTTLLLRQLLERTVEDSVRPLGRLGDEVDFLGRYLEIERMRFGDRLSVAIRITEEASHATVPSLLLQPLVENAIKHGISRRPGPGRIDVDASLRGVMLDIVVADDGPGPSPARRSDAGIGLRNTVERLGVLFGEGNAVLQLQARPTGGTEVRISVPFRRFPPDLGIDTEPRNGVAA
ncbi:MAG: histidine kinase [Thermoanaerobaculia bacterium]